MRAEEGQGTLWGGAGGRQGTLFLRGVGGRWPNFFIDFFGRLAACLSQGSPVGKENSKEDMDAVTEVGVPGRYYRNAGQAGPTLNSKFKSFSIVL